MTASSVIVSIIVCLLVLFGVVFFHLAQTGYTHIEQKIYDILQVGDKGLTIDVGSVDGTLMKTITLNNVHIFATQQDRQQEVATIERIGINTNLWQVAKAVLGLENPHLDITLYNIYADISDNTLEIFNNIAIREDSQETYETTEKTTESISTNFSFESSITLNISNAVLNVNVSGIQTTVENINASADLDENLSFKSATINIPQMKLPIMELNVKIDDVRLSIDEDFVISASINKVFSEDFQFQELSTITKIDSTHANIAFYIQNSNVTYHDTSSTLEGSTFMVDINLENKEEILVEGSVAKVKLASNEPSLSALLSGLYISTVIDTKSSIDLYLYITDSTVSKDDISIISKNLEINFDSNLDFSNALGNVKFEEFKTKDLGEYYNKYSVEYLALSNFEMDFSLNNTGMENALNLRLKTILQGKSSNTLIDKFSTNMDADLSIAFNDDSFKITAGVANLSNLCFAAIPESANLVASYSTNDELNLSFSVLNESQVNISSTIFVSIIDGTVDARFYLENLMPFSYEVLYRQFLSSQDFIQKETSFDGSLVFSLSLEQLNLLDNLTIDSLKQNINAGRFSFNLAVHDVNVEGTNYSGAVTFESTLNGTVLDIGTLAVSTRGFRLSYNGKVDYNQLIPDGTLFLQRSNDGNELARLDFNSIDGTLLYSFKITSPLVKNTIIQGTLNWQNSEEITASAQLESSFIAGGNLPFVVTVIKSPFEVFIKSNNVDLEILLSSQRELSALGYIKGLSVRATDTLFVGVDVDVNLAYDLLSGSLHASLKDLTIRISDLLEFGFSTEITNTNLNIHDLFILQRGERASFVGTLNVSYETLSDLISFDPQRINGQFSFYAINGISYAKGTVTEGYYYLESTIDSFIDLKITLLGSKGIGFHSYGSVNWGDNDTNGFSFNSEYRGGRLSFYDSNGRIGSLDLNNVGLELDFNKMEMEFSFSFINTVEKRTKPNAVQSGTISLTGRIETLASGLLSVLAGLDSDLNFTLSLANFKLEEPYSIPNTSMNIFYSNGLVSIDGSLVNGKIDLNENYIDIHVNKELLFGFNIKGYVGEELDLLVSDLFFPLPIIEQFSDMMLCGFTRGDITGDVLIKGSKNDPLFYGMLYCQTFEMWLAYLPKQTLVVNNVAIALQEHSITIPQTPYIGYSDLDGRFLKGLVSVAMDIQNLNFDNIDIFLDIQTPINLWVPLLTDSNEFELRGDTIGSVIFSIRNNMPYLTCVVTASNMLIDFKIENKEDWLYYMQSPINLDITLTTGSDVQFCYPEKDNAFLDFTFNEGETVRATYSMETRKIETSGSFSFKTGQVYYFQNDFYISEGSLDLTRRKYNTNKGGISFQLDLTARLKDYDSSGNKVEINLILQNATLDNISPRFTSTPSMSETDILALLGQTILPSSTLDQNVSVASVASIAAAATDAFTRLGLIESNSNYSLSSIIRDSLGLDIFSLRSSVLQNIIIDALPGELAGSGNLTLLSRYLDGTSLFAGSYLRSGVFAQMSLRLKADRTGKRNAEVGHFLSSDLMLDMEFSIDWDNPMGTFTIFTNPQELSPFNILDSIGFSVTKRIQF